MVNHIRTVLLNVPAVSAPDSIFISPDFRAVALPQAYQKLYGLFLPAELTDAKKSQRLATLMRLLHADDYVEYTLLPDRRITYDPFSTDEFFNTEDDVSASIDYTRLFEQALGETYAMAELKVDLFAAVRRYPTIMAQLRQITNSGVSTTGRLTGIILALAYQLDNLQ